MKISFHPLVLILLNVRLGGKSSRVQSSVNELFWQFSEETTQPKMFDDNNFFQIHTRTKLLSFLHPSVYARIYIYTHQRFLHLFLWWNFFLIGIKQNTQQAYHPYTRCKQSSKIGTVSTLWDILLEHKHSFIIKTD